MARSARRRHGGGRQAARGRRKHADGTEMATQAMTAVRLVLTVWELVRAIACDGWPGGPGRLL
jgi:hypothetical protein